MQPRVTIMHTDLGQHLSDFIVSDTTKSSIFVVGSVCHAKLTFVHLDEICRSQDWHFKC